MLLSKSMIHHWVDMSKKPNLSEEEIYINRDYLDWYYVCQRQTLSEILLLK